MDAVQYRASCTTLPPHLIGTYVPASDLRTVILQAGSPGRKSEHPSHRRLKMLPQDPQVAPLIQVFELYMLQDAVLADMQEPTVIATRAMLDAGLTPEIILSILDSAIDVAASGAAGAQADVQARELRAHIGPWLLNKCFHPDTAHRDVPLLA
jgi:hypothetical protein